MWVCVGGGGGGGGVGGCANEQILSSFLRCVIGELFTDGRQLFDLSQLLELRARHSEYSPEILLKKIDKPVRVG